MISLGLIAGFCAQLAKLSYDALVQRDVSEVVRTSVFARSETVFQICSVFGGALGISLPLIPQLGFGVIAVILCVLLVRTLVSRRRATASVEASAARPVWPSVHPAFQRTKVRFVPDQDKFQQTIGLFR